MNRKILLEHAIATLAQQAGVIRPAFHVMCVSKDSAGLFIMQTMWPQGRLICEAIARAVAGFPKDHYTTCVALLPELVDDIIRAVRPGQYAADVAADGTQSAQCQT